MQARVATRPDHRRAQVRHWWQRPLTATEMKILFWPPCLLSTALAFRWQAIPVVLALMVWVAIHEHGHLWAADQLHLRHKGYLPLPCGGGVALIVDGKTPKEEAIVSLMGPIFSLATLLAVLATGWAMQWTSWQATAVVMALINLANLLPFRFLDGGLVLSSVGFGLHRWLGTMMVLIGPIVLEMAVLRIDSLLYRGALIILLILVTVDAINYLSRWWIHPLLDLPAGGRVEWWHATCLVAYLAVTGLTILVVYYGLTHPQVAESVIGWTRRPGF